MQAGCEKKSACEDLKSDYCKDLIVILYRLSAAGSLTCSLALT